MKLDTATPRTIFGVGARLLLAFLAISGFSIAAAVATLWLFRDVGTTVDRISDHDVPSALAALELSAQAAYVTATGPKLLATTDGAAYERLSAEASVEVERLRDVLENLRDAGTPPASIAPINAAVDWLALNVLSLDTLVASRIELAIEKAERLQELAGIRGQIRQAIAASESTSSLSDSADSSVRRADSVAAPNSVDHVQTLDTSDRTLQVTIEREVATLGAFLALASVSEERLELSDLDAQARASMANLERIIAPIEMARGGQLAQTMNALRSVTTGSSSVFALREAELHNLDSARQVLLADAKASAQLRSTVADMMRATKERIAGGAQSVQDRQRDGRRLLTLIAVFAVISSALIFWLYVWRGLLRRLTTLSSATLAISSGDLDIQLPADTRDEIGVMTRALGQFRANAFASRKTDEALRESEASFRNLIEGSIQGTVIHRDWIALFANQACADMLGYASPDEIMALKSIMEFCAPREHSRLRGYAERRIRGEYAPAHYEIEAIRKDGSTRILQVAVSLTSWKRERATQLAMFDVTERRMAERELRTNEARLRAFFNNSPQAMSIADVDGRYIEANKRVGEIYGTSTADLRGKMVQEVMPAASANRLIRIDRAIIDAKASKQAQIEVPSEDGTLHISVVRFLVRDGSGKVTGIGAIDTDITDAVRSQQQATRLRSAIEAAQDGLILYDQAQRVVFTNAAFHRIHEPAPSPSSIVGMTRREVAQIIVSADWIRDTDALTDPKGYVERLLERPINESDERTFANGRTYLRRHRGLDDGAMLTLLTDITDRKEAECALAESEAELRRLATEVSLAEERERRRIASELHDGAIQNLGLARIMFGSLTKSGGLGDNQQAQKIRKLLEQCVRELRTLLSELSPPALYDLGVAEALDWLTERFRTRHGLNCTLRVEGHPAALAKNVEVMLFQVVRELLINVTKHAQANNVDIRLWQVNDTLSVCVSDDGIGLDTSLLDRPPSDTHGFGLFSVRERLRLLGGQMQVVSNGGAQITVSVPVSAGQRD